MTFTDFERRIFEKFDRMEANNREDHPMDPIV